LEMMKDIAIEVAALSPPILTAAYGSLRRVGVEIEFLAPSAHVAAQALEHATLRPEIREQ
jgi:hypothetical protein